MKNATPTKVGGQAILEGIMMRGSRALAVGIRLPSGDIHLTCEPLKKPGGWKKVPIVRGVVSFISSLVTGTSVLMYGAEVLEAAIEEEGGETEKPGKFDAWLEAKFGKDASFTFSMIMSVILAVVLVVGIFIILPTFIVSAAQKMGITNVFALNLFEGVLRIVMFVAYIAVISMMPDIRRTFE
ncbi:MAG: DUF1385 domain-containing protein [Firmicutes bacterium]|nr:DUF1385 domain-containing protein [Bacillota bacterium]